MPKTKYVKGQLMVSVDLLPNNDDGSNNYNTQWMDVRSAAFLLYLFSFPINLKQRLLDDMSKYPDLKQKVINFVNLYYKEIILDINNFLKNNPDNPLQLYVNTIN